MVKQFNGFQFFCRYFLRNIKKTIFAVELLANFALYANFFQKLFSFLVVGIEF